MNLILNGIFVLFLMFHVTNSFALSSDLKEKMYVTADSTLYNYKTGVTSFEGHVKINQGTTHITADRVTTKTNLKHQIQEAIAYGIQQPAHYWALLKTGNPEVQASANIIKFFPLATNVTLEKNVRIMQGENSFEGQLIIYNRHEQTITVPAYKNSRAVLVYNPDK